MSRSTSLKLQAATRSKRLADSATLQKVRIDRTQETTRVYCDDDQLLRHLAGRLEGAHYYLRQTNLEDVFLKATGRALNEKQ